MNITKPTGHMKHANATTLINNVIIELKLMRSRPETIRPDMFYERVIAMLSQAREEVAHCYTEPLKHYE